VRPIAEGGHEYALENLITLCRRCHMRQHRGDGSMHKPPLSTPSPDIRGTNCQDEPLIGQRPD
jgi:HNH endonuclease